MKDLLLNKLFNMRNERDIKKLRPYIARINSIGHDLKKLSPGDLRSLSGELRVRADKGESPDSILNEAFALVRAISGRTLGLAHYDVQLMGGIILHQGKIAEMKTGEGKTLTATLPVFLNAITGTAVHIVTFNDYLAKRDAQWMAPVYSALGLSVGFIENRMSTVRRKEAYACDITYGSNKEFGFDYLRDNLILDEHSRVQRELDYSIVDEVDSILIDEARTPLIVSSSSQESDERYITANKIIPMLTEGRDFEVEKKEKRALFTEDGIRRIEGILNTENLYDPNNIIIVQALHQALRARSIYQRDVDYIVKDGSIMIVDEFTGRVLQGRKYSDGLHQAIEAKEMVRISTKTGTNASITYQNYFRMYKKLSGMTGTAASSLNEFKSIYDLDVTAVPTNMPVIRTDHDDIVFATEAEKNSRIVQEIDEMRKMGRPVLIGTRSVSKSERLSGLLQSRGIRHNLLNARNNDMEAGIIAEAGVPGCVTIATNMAGRGTDIILGGSKGFIDELNSFAPQSDPVPWDENRSLIMHGEFNEAEGTVSRLNEKDRTFVIDIIKKGRAWLVQHESAVRNGGLHVIGTEKHDSLRVDNQLRGRSGRQGDPGSSIFFVSLEDDLVKLYGSFRIKKLNQGAEALLPGETYGEIQDREIVKEVIQAQINIESKNFMIRRNLFEFDQILNSHREFIYRERKKILEGTGIRSAVEDYIETVVRAQIESLYDSNDGVKSIASISGWLSNYLSIDIGMLEIDTTGNSLSASVKNYKDVLLKIYAGKDMLYGAETMRQIEKNVPLRIIDILWKEHLQNLGDLREGIWTVRYGSSKNKPVIEYGISANALFQEMMSEIKFKIVEHLFKVKPVKDVEKEGNTQNQSNEIVPEQERKELYIQKDDDSGNCNPASGDQSEQGGVKRKRKRKKK